MVGGSLFQEELLKGQYHPQIDAYYFRQWEGFQMPYHQHESTEIMYMISGHCHIDIQVEERVEAVGLKKGEFIVLDSNVPHRLIVEAGHPCRMLNVEFAFAAGNGPGPTLKQLSEEEAALTAMATAACPYFILRDPDEVYHLLKSLVLELDSRGMQPTLLVRLMFAQLLIRIARLRQEAKASVSGQEKQYYVKRCLAFMHQNYDREIQVRDIAAAVSLHPGYLHRVFKAYTGQTLMGYLASFRMEKARMLLQQTNIPVIEVADYVGINSRQYFHLLFKKHTGLTPVQYRQSITRHRYRPD